MSEPIYLDNNATTVVDPRVFEVMKGELTGPPANPSSVHLFGREARNQLTKARRSVAESLGVRSKEVLFTSGGTEALNLILRGLDVESGHIITSNVEHAAVVTTLAELPHEVEELPAGIWGAVRPTQIEAALRPNTRAIVLMAANNETGVVTDLKAIAAIAEEANVPLIVDGVALLGKERLTIPSGISAICFSGHKCHGPKGTGALIVRPDLPFSPQITGGGQEYGRRGGTENLAGILGFAEALRCFDSFEEVRNLRDKLEKGILELFPKAEVNGEGLRVSNTTNIAFTGMDGEGLLMNLDMAGMAVSHGSACSSGALEPSRVLVNMGYSKERAATSLRFSLSRFTTEEEIDRALKMFQNCSAAF